MEKSFLDLTNEKLTERESNILRYVVEGYIDTAKPIPSKWIKGEYHLGISPATIRNTLHQLELQGFIDQAHISSGRIPTDKGYRYYVDHLMAMYSTEGDVEVQFPQDLKEIAFHAEDVLQRIASYLSEITHLFGYSFLKKQSPTKLLNFDMIKLNSGKILIVLEFDSENIRTVILDLDKNIRDIQLDTTKSILYERLVGLTVNEIQNEIDGIIRDNNDVSEELANSLFASVKTILLEESSGFVFTSNKEFLLLNHEMKFSSDIPSALRFLENSEWFINNFVKGTSDQDLDIKIGSENQDVVLKNCAIISGTFKVGDLTGKLGIVGPRRIPYSRICLLIKRASTAIEKF